MSDFGSLKFWDVVIVGAGPAALRIGCRVDIIVDIGARHAADHRAHYQ